MLTRVTGSRPTVAAKGIHTGAYYASTCVGIDVPLESKALRRNTTALFRAKV